jgi:hypothetical protein
VAGRYGNGTAARKADIACVAPSWRSRSVAKCLPPASALAISAGGAFSSTCPEGQIPGHVDEKWSSLMRTYKELIIYGRVKPTRSVLPLKLSSRTCGCRSVS